MVTQLCTLARNHWIVHLKFIVCINLLKISRMNLMMKCFYENLKHSSRERNSHSLDIPATRSYQLLVLVSEKSKKLWLSFLHPGKNSQCSWIGALEFKSWGLVFACDLWNIALTHIICPQLNMTRLYQVWFFLSRNMNTMLFAYVEQFNVIIGSEVDMKKIISFLVNFWQTTNTVHLSPCAYG